MAPKGDGDDSDGLEVTPLKGFAPLMPLDPTEVRLRLVRICSRLGIDPDGKEGRELGKRIAMGADIQVLGDDGQRA